MGILVTRETMAAPASASQQSQDLMNQVTRLQDQVKEIQSIVKLQVPSNLKDVSGGAVMDEEVVEGNPYSRLMRLNKTSMVNHYENIQNHSVAIIGLGGIGAVCAEMLSRAGIGKLILFDKKTVAPTDLNRLFYRPEHVGLSKTQATKATLISVNAHVLVETYSLDVTTKDAEELIADRLRTGAVGAGDQVDLIISCVDNRDARLVVNNVRRALKLPWMDSSTFTNGLTGCVQFIPDGAMALEFASDVAVVPGSIMPSLPTTTSILAGVLTQNVLKHLLGFGVVQRYLGVNTVDNSTKMEPPADSTDLV